METFGTHLEANKDLLETIRERTEQGLASTLIAIPGIRESLLRGQMIEYLKESNNRLVVVYLSVSDMLDRSPEGFYRSLYGVLAKELLRKEYHLLNAAQEQQLKEDLATSLPDGSQIIYYHRIRDLVAQFFDGGEYRLLLNIQDISKLEAPPSFFASLASIRHMNRDKISFLFFDTPNLRDQVSVKTHEALYEQLIGAIVWLKLPSKDDFEKDVEYWEGTFDYQLPNALKDFVWHQTGGHPSLTKHIVFYFSENSRTKYDMYTLLEYYTINSKLEHIVSVLTQEEVAALIRLAEGSDAHERIPQELIDSLMSYDLIRSEKDGYELTIGLLQDFLLREHPQKYALDRQFQMGYATDQGEARVIMKGSSIFVEGELINEEFTGREVRILEYMISKNHEVVSRDDLGKVIWGSKATENYSDWSLDQTMSRLRKKLGDNGYQPKYIKTLRGRGFKLL